MTAPATVPGYSLSRTFVLRTTGFPIDWIERVAPPRLAAAIDEARALQEHSFAQARAILESLDGISRSARRKLKRGIPVGNSVRVDGARPMIIGGFTAVSWRAAHFPWTC